MNPIARSIHVSGLVQGVGYRQFAATVATALGLTGYCENLADGRVHLEVEGAAAAVEDFMRQLHIGPARARVVEVVVRTVAWAGAYRAFEIRQ